MGLPAPMMKLSYKAFTLSELLLAATILVFCLAGLLLFFVNAIILNETNRNFILAYSAIEAKMEEIKNMNFTDLDSLNGTNFDLNSFSSGNGKGKIVVSSESSGLKQIKITACFMSRNRLIGDDIISCQSSPVELTTFIAQ